MAAAQENVAALVLMIDLLIGPKFGNQSSLNV